jgi:hypothetical protein
LDKPLSKPKGKHNRNQKSEAVIIVTQQFTGYYTRQTLQEEGFSVKYNRLMQSAAADSIM